jgi:hypothetical protein
MILQNGFRLRNLALWAFLSKKIKIVAVDS